MDNNIIKINIYLSPIILLYSKLIYLSNIAIKAYSKYNVLLIIDNNKIRREKINK